jgi:glycosyltransferase involved in cell wall biosynthesis
MVDILLASYNSEKYLSAQIDSIIAQSFQNWRLIIRDAGSEDDTLQIIEKYRAMHPDKIVFTGSAPASALENFSALLENSDAEYSMFCDHDDVWFPHKIKLTLDSAVKTEELYGKDVPVCVFTDALVTDENLHTVHNSNLRNQHLDAVNGTTPARLLVQNVPSGNTMLINAALRKIITPIPADAVIHDHYTALAAACTGHLVSLDEPTLFYRQHNNNLLGSGSYSLFSMIRKSFEGRKVLRERFFANCRQAQSLLEQNRKILSPETQKLLGDFAQMEKLNWFQRKKLFIRNGYWKTGFLRNIGMMILI